MHRVTDASEIAAQKLRRVQTAVSLVRLGNLPQFLQEPSCQTTSTGIFLAKYLVFNIATRQNYK